MDCGLPNLRMIPQPTDHLPLSACSLHKDTAVITKQGARPAARRAGPLLLTLYGRGTARRAPTEILEQDRPHHIAPGLTCTCLSPSTINSVSVSCGIRNVVARPEIATANLKLEFLFERVPVVDVQFPANGRRLICGASGAIHCLRGPIPIVVAVG